jgi:hypothetical protein
MTTLITQTSINTIVPANAGLNLITLSSDNSPVTLVYPSIFVQSPYFLAAAIILTKAEGYTGGVVIMPNAYEITQSIVTNILNQSASPILIKNFEGGEIYTIAPGKSVLFYLLPLETPTPAGNWYALEIGTGASGADAAALAGFGLIALNNKLNSYVATNEQDLSVVLNNDLDAKLLNWIGSTYTIDLDSFTTPMPGFYFLIKNSSADSADLTLQATSIDGGTSVILGYNQSCIVVYINSSSSWKTVGLGNFAFGNAIQFSSTGIRLINGNATVPSLSYITQPTTGLFSRGETDVSITNGGAETMNFKTDGIILKSGNYKLGSDLLLELATIYP